MKRKFLVLFLFALIIVSSLALSACVKPIVDIPTEEEPTKPENTFAFDAVCEVIGEETYVVYEAGMYYIASKEKGIISRPFYEYDDYFCRYENFPDCISIRLTPTGSLGFMKTDGILLSPLNSDGSDFAYAGYDQIYHSTDIFENKNYIQIFLCNASTGKGQLLNTSNFNFAGEPYWNFEYGIYGNAYYGYVYLEEAIFNEETKVYDFETYLVNAKNGQKIIKIDYSDYVSVNQYEDFGLESGTVGVFQTTLPATETENEKIEYAIVSLANASVIAKNVKSFFVFDTLGTFFYGYSKDWNEESEEYNKIYFVNSSMQEEEFSADIFYSKENVAVGDNTVSYQRYQIFHPNGIYLYFKNVESALETKTDIIIAKLGDSKFTTLSAGSGAEVKDIFASSPYYYIVNTLTHPEGLRNAYNITAFSRQSLEPVFVYTVPFDTEENTYDVIFNVTFLGKNEEIAVTKLTLFENRFKENEKISEFLYIKKGASPVVIKELPKDVSTKFYYVETTDDLLVSLVETDTTHDTGFEDTLCALWMPLQGEFTNTWHKSIKLNLGSGLSYAEIIDFDKIFIVEIFDNQTLLSANSITPYLSEIDFRGELINLPNISETLDYNYYDTIDENQYLASTALVFSTDSQGFFKAYPIVNVNIILPLQTPVFYNALIYSEKGENDIYRLKAKEFPDTSSCELDNNVAYYNNAYGYGSQKVTITEKEQGGLNFDISESDYSYRYNFTLNDQKYFIIRNKTNYMRGLLNEAGEMILAPVFDKLDYIVQKINGVEVVFIIVEKLDSPAVYKMEGNSIKLIVDYGYFMVTILDFGMIGILPNGNAHVIDFEGNVLGEYDTAWFSQDFYEFSLIDIMKEFEHEDFLQLNSIVQISTYCEQNQKYNRPQSFLIFNPYFYIVKSGNGYSFYSRDFSVEGFTDVVEIDKYGGKDKNAEGPENKTGYGENGFENGLAFLKDGKFTPYSLFSDYEEEPELIGKWTEFDYNNLYYGNFKTYSINWAR